MRKHRNRAIRSPLDENPIFRGPGLGRRGARHSSFESGGGQRRRRLFDAEAMRLLALHMLAQEPRHGYDLIRALGEQSGGAWSPSPGMVYPMLTMLVDMGLIQEDEQTSGSRKRFYVTEEGKAEVAKHAGEVERLLAKLAGLAGDAAKIDPAPVRRAMHNLRLALIERLRRDHASEQTVFDAAALIDSAAQAIERL